MSGTSADGVSAAWIDVGRTVRLRAFATTPYPRALRERVLSLKESGAREICEVNVLLGEIFAQAAGRLIRRVGRRPDVIGSHGQTVLHAPGRASLQIGEPSVIAERTGVTTVADFRPRDIAAGGEGAPLVPIFDEIVFGGRHVRAMQNLGGIANVTLVGRGVRTVAFDTGPGNCLLDEAVRRITRGREGMDLGGRRAVAGGVDGIILKRLLAHPFLNRRPPKSTGREEFSTPFLDACCEKTWRQRPNDLIATLTEFTARSIAEAYRRFLPPVKEVVVSGGGVYNQALMFRLEAHLFPAPVRSIRMYGWDPLSKEPAAFALLAVRTLRGLAGNVPAATGARPAVLGKIVPGRNWGALKRRRLIP